MDTPGTSRRSRGRPKGSPNRATADVRKTIALIAERKAPQVEQWLSDVEDPGKRVELYLRLIEYHIPKLSRAEVTGEGGGALQVQIVRFSDGRPDT